MKPNDFKIIIQVVYTILFKSLIFVEKGEKPYSIGLGIFAQLLFSAFLGKVIEYSREKWNTCYFYAIDPSQSD